MKIKKVNRYYCDFCKKANCSGGAIKRHEERCTMNPNRKCGMCSLVQANQKPMSELLALLPDPKQFEISNDWGKSFTDGLATASNLALDTLKEKTGGCPACILAALRQKGIPVWMTNFNFKAECEAVWTDVNELAYEGISCYQ
jgi:hypothetical protein